MILTTQLEARRLSGEEMKKLVILLHGKVFKDFPEALTLAMLKTLKWNGLPVWY